MEHYGNHNATSSAYNSPIPSIAPQQLQNGSLPSLNALQSQQGSNGINSYQMYGQPITAPHTPSTSAPNTPGSAGNGGFQSLGGQNAPQSYRPAGPSYGSSMQSYNPSASMMPGSSSSMSHPQAIAPAPALAPAPRGLVPLRPMVQPSMGMGGHMNPGMSYGQQNLPQENDTPTHVVGSQGRRGILPSAPGRPQVTATGPGSTKNAVIPAKDADGKFPCPHCTKTYLHAKHLKRHLLRHTGDRPYMCILCRDTFSRSDILKRHFQKCSIRRGNPTGASHLSHAQAHLKKPNQGSHKSTPSGSGMQTLNGLPNGGPDPGNYPFGIIPASPDKVDDNSPHNMSRANSLKGIDNGARDRRGMTGPTPNGSSRTSFEDQAYGGNIPSSMSSSMNPSLAAFSMSNGQNGSSFAPSYNFASPNGAMNGQGNDGMPSMGGGRGVMPMYGGGQQWNAGPSQSYFQPGAQDGFMSSYNPSLGQTQVQNQPAIKAESSLTHSNPGLFTGMYPMAGSGADVNGSLGGASSWAISPDPLAQVTHRIVNFCCPSESSGSQSIRQYLSQDNVKHFLDQYHHFQGHFPIIHMPSFHITEASEGLLLAMICIGAVYSDRIRPMQVRDLMEQAKAAIEKDSPAYLAASRGTECHDSMLATGKKELEDMQAIVLMQILFIWHGTPVQRERIRRKFPIVVKLCKDTGLARPSATPELFSVLHQPNVTVENVNSANFDWNIWVQQEKRSRLFYVIFLLDAAMALYFNIAPQFDAFGVNLPLPADDAAWDAKTATQCADALGLHGPVAAKATNLQGSRRPKQPEMQSALKSLMDPRSTFDAGNTNLYSKFVLVHALHVQLWRAQASLAQNGESSIITRGSGTSTPMSQRSTPVDQDAGAPYSLRLVEAALQKWKNAWDIDMNQQYPPTSQHYRRFGFCRDAIHFFYLGRYLLQNKVDWQMAPDQRFSHIMAVLKYVKGWAVSDSARRGEDLGSVSDISQDYGVTDLTLDMAQLFKPANKLIDSPINGVHTNLGHSML